MHVVYGEPDAVEWTVMNILKLVIAASPLLLLFGVLGSSIFRGKEVQERKRVVSGKKVKKTSSKKKAKDGE